MSSFKSIEINIVQGQNLSRSKHWSSQSCMNLYLDTQTSGRTASALLPWPGEKPFSAGTSGTINRGLHVVKGVAYTVIDQALYKVNASGTQTYLAIVPGNTRLNFADDGFNLLMRTSGSAAFINGKFILQGNAPTYLWNGSELKTLSIPTLTNDDEFIVSGVDQPENYQSTQIGNAILDGDALKEVYVFQRKIIFGGDSSIEFFYDAGEGDPAIQVIQQASTTEIGVASSHSMAETPNHLYFLGSDNLVYRVTNFDIQSVTPSAMAREIASGATDDAAGFTCNLDSQWFYILQLDTANQTFAYSEKTGTWIKLSSGVKGAKHLMSGYAYAYGKHLISDSTSSTVYEWDFDTYTSDGEIIVRQFDTAAINNLMLGTPGKRLLMNRVRFVMETGTGNLSDIDPQMMVSSSIDGGRSFDDEDWIAIGRAGQSTSLADWYHSKLFYDIFFRVRVSDPVFTSFHSATIDVKTAGD